MNKLKLILDANLKLAGLCWTVREYDIKIKRFKALLLIHTETYAMYMIL